MAIIFELVLNFGTDWAAAQEACRRVAAHPPLTAGPHHIPLHEPLIAPAPSIDGPDYLEMSVMPVGVGFGVASEHGRPPLSLTPEQLSELGHGLYRVLATLSGYQAALVGWDPEPLLDLAELRQERADDIQAGTLPGLVLARDLELGIPTPNFVPFAPGYIWIPYAGQTPSRPTVGEAPPAVGPRRSHIEDTGGATG
jgi:hypothetical protein